MNKDDKDDLSFRDQCAMHMLQMLIARDESKGIINLLINYGTADEYQKKWHDSALKDLEKLTHLSYKIADLMRKARLASFE